MEGAAAMAALLASQLVSLPIASNAGGFSWNYDSDLGIWTRTVDSFGSHTMERAHTIGRNKVNLGYTYQRFTFDELDGDSISINSTGQVSTAPALHLVENLSLSRADVSVNSVFVNYGINVTH